MIRNFIIPLLCLAAFRAAAQTPATRQARPIDTNVVRKESPEEENESYNEEHMRQRWYKMMGKEHADYVKVKNKFDRYFRKHPFEGSATKEYGTEWLLQNLFYLDRRHHVQRAPAIDYNAIKALATPPPATATDTMAGDWRMLGPRNTVHVGAGVGNAGGYGYCVRIDPTNANKYFVSFVTGGLWVSSDGGNIWRLTDANLPDMVYYDIDVCRANSNYVYAVSDSAVIKSVDGGLTWMPTALNATNYPGATGYDIAACPSNPNLVLARWGTNVYRTMDGGQTWTVVASGLKKFSVWDSDLNSEVIDWHATDPNVVYFTDRGDNDVTVDVYRSGDQGGSFVKITSLTPAITSNNITGWSKILTATNAPGAVYIAIGTGTNAYSHHAVHLFKIDATTGAALLTRTNMIDGVDQSYGSPTMLHHGDLAMDIHNDQNIVWGSYSQTHAQYSTDNGVTFKTSTSEVHADLRGVSMMDGKVLLGTDGSGVVSTDSGNNFTIVTSSISNHELWGFGSAFKSDILGAGCNHGPLSIRDYEAAGGWYTALGADQGNTDVNPLDSVTLYSQGYDSYHVTRTGIKTFTNGAQQVDPGGIYAYFNTMSFHPHLFNTLITHHAGGYPSSVPQATRDIWKKSLIRSDDNGVTIDSVIHTFSTQVFREKICYTNPSYMYVVEGLTGNHLWKTSDGGLTWMEITPGTSVTGASIRNISDVAVSDVNAGEIWITYSGVQNTCQVLHSTDGGGSYTNLTTSVLGSFPVTKIIFQRGTNGGVYVGSKAGVFYRNNTMSDWQRLGQGLPRTDVRFMFINYYKGNQGKLLIGTSRGAWDHDLYEHSQPMAQIAASTASPSCQSPLVQFRDYSVVSSGGSGATYSWTFEGGTPATSTSETPLVSYLGAASGGHTVTLTVTDQYGTSTQTLTGFIHFDSSRCCQGAPSGWQFTDIGAVASPGNLCYTAADKNFKITSNGTGLSDPNDAFSFVYDTLKGDGIITARVKDVSANYNYSAGIMIRNTLAPNSSYVFLNSLDTRGVFDIWRTTDGGSTGYHPVTSLAMPMWLKLQRKGKNITSFYSSDGGSWTPYNSYTLPLNSSVFVGLAASGKGCVADIDSVYVGVAPPCVGGSANGCPSLDTIPGQALSFYDYSYFNAPFALPATNTFTITGWIKPKGMQFNQSGLVAWDNGYLFLGQNDDNELGYDWNGNAATDAWQSGLFVPSGKWSFIAMVVRPDSASFYLNDKMATHVISEASSAVVNPILGNSNQGAGYYLGAMDELTVWNRALSTDEIDSLRHLTKEKIVDRGSAGYDSSLVAYFQFNDNNATSSYNLVDSSYFPFGYGAGKMRSTAPVGAGVSARAKVEEKGAYKFGESGMRLTFHQKGIPPDGNVWVTKINQLPDTTPKALASSPAYWVIDNYGKDSLFSDLRAVHIKDAMNITANETLSPDSFMLFKREVGVEGVKWGAPVCKARDAMAGNPGSLGFGTATINSSDEVIVVKGFIPPPVVDTAPGKALVLGGYPDKLVVNDLSVSAVNTFTITGWIKPAGIQKPFSALVTNAATATIFMLRNNNELGYQWHDDGWSWGSGLTVPADQWSFIAVVVNPSSATLYLNNQKAVRTGLNNPVLTLNGFCFGEDNRGYTNRSFVGQMDEMTIWNRALSDDEIRALRHLTKEKQTDYTLSTYDGSLIGYFQFNGPADTAALNIVSDSVYPFTGKATVDVSTAPVGGGVSAKAAVVGPGVYHFGGPGVTMGFSGGSVPGGDVWVSRINQKPNGLPNSYAGSSSYWIVNNYGTASGFGPLDSIVFDRALRVRAVDSPSFFRLYKRPDNAEGDSSWGAVQARGTSVVSGRYGDVTFGVGNNISSFGQFYITSSSAVETVDMTNVSPEKTQGPSFVKIWPNPVQHDHPLTVRNLGEASVEITFYLVDGRLLRRYRIAGGSEIHVSDLPKEAILYKAVNSRGKESNGVVLVQ